MYLLEHAKGQRYINHTQPQGSATSYLTHHVCISPALNQSRSLVPRTPEPRGDVHA